MRLLTVQQPRAYLAGVLLGDGWLSLGGGRSPGGYFCLRVADEDFANAFAASIDAGFGAAARVGRDERGFWLVRRYNGSNRFDILRGFEPRSAGEKAAWLLGLFDSEGNVQLTAKPYRGPRSWERRIAFYSTEPTTLRRAAAHMDALALPATIKVRRPTAGHLGTKQVEELRLRSSRDTFARFASTVGSNIARKQEVLDQLPETYCADLTAVRREMQAMGAATRRSRRDNGGIY